MPKVLKGGRERCFRASGVRVPNSLLHGAKDPVLGCFPRCGTRLAHSAQRPQIAFSTLLKYFWAFWYRHLYQASGVAIRDQKRLGMAKVQMNISTVDSEQFEGHHAWNMGFRGRTGQKVHPNFVTNVAMEFHCHAFLRPRMMLVL